MAKLNVAPTKSNLLAIKEQLAISTEGYDLLEQKREILVMELMKVVERVRLLEADIDKCIAKAYPSLKNMLMNVGGEKAERIAKSVSYDFHIDSKPVVIGGMNFTTLDVVLPERKLFSSIIGSYPDSDQVMEDFFLFQPKQSIPAAIRFSNTAITVERLAKVMKMKKRLPQIRPPVIWTNT